MSDTPSPPSKVGLTKQWAQETLRIAEDALLDPTKTLAQRATALRLKAMLSTWKPLPLVTGRYSQVQTEIMDGG